nr:MAG TPA: hypothetical protein [Caudoviricetes sp.]
MTKGADERELCSLHLLLKLPFSHVFKRRLHGLFNPL